MNRIIISKGVYDRMKELVALYEDDFNISSDSEEPVYLEKIEIQSILEYNPNFGDNKECKCGHSYYRHFDSYEGMDSIGCKYCPCDEFELAPPPEPKDVFTLDFERVFGSN